MTHPPSAVPLASSRKCRISPVSTWASCCMMALLRWVVMTPLEKCCIQLSGLLQLSHPPSQDTLLTSTMAGSCCGNATAQRLLSRSCPRPKAAPTSCPLPAPSPSCRSTPPQVASPSRLTSAFPRLRHCSAVATLPPALFALMPRRRQHHRHVHHQNSGGQGRLSALAPPTAVPPAERGTGNM